MDDSMNVWIFIDLERNYIHLNVELYGKTPYFNVTSSLIFGMKHLNLFMLRDLRHICSFIHFKNILTAH